MIYDPQKHHRRSIRLKGYDYSQAGAYYVTIVAQNRACLFGDVVNAEIQLNDAGQMVQAEWETLPIRFPNIELDEFIVMPNHFHGILVITDKTVGAVSRARLEDGQPQEIAPTKHIVPTVHNPILGEIIGAWKSIVTGKYIDGVHQLNWQPFDRKLLQRNYWEHIVHDEPELNRIREYIINNPANWDSDDNNPKNAKP
jgi:putative transposase